MMVKGRKRRLVHFQFKSFTEVVPGQLPPGAGLDRAVTICSNDDLVSRRHVAFKIFRQVRDRLQKVIIMACSWCVEGHKKQGFLENGYLDTNNPLIGALEEVNARIDVIPQTKKSKPPNIFKRLVTRYLRIPLCPIKKVHNLDFLANNISYLHLTHKF